MIVFFDVCYHLTSGTIEINGTYLVADTNKEAHCERAVTLYNYFTFIEYNDCYTSYKTIKISLRVKLNFN